MLPQNYIISDSRRFSPASITHLSGIISAEANHVGHSPLHSVTCRDVMSILWRAAVFADEEIIVISRQRINESTRRRRGARDVMAVCLWPWEGVVSSSYQYIYLCEKRWELFQYLCLREEVGVVPTALRWEVGVVLTALWWWVGDVLAAIQEEVGIVPASLRWEAVVPADLWWEVKVVMAAVVPAALEVVVPSTDFCDEGTMIGVPGTCVNV